MMRITNNFYKFSQSIQYTNQPVFTSNREHEAMLAALREAQDLEMQRRYNNLDELLNYDIHDHGCHNMAQFTLNFTCAIENDSEHNLDEFFKSEEEASKLRSKLSPECQKNSLEIRNEIQKQPVFKDPVLALVSAKEMKEFIPDKEILNNAQFANVIDAAKKSYVDAINTSDKTKFNDSEKALIEELTGIIKKTKGLEFGEEFDKLLETLVESVKARRQEVTQIINKQKIINPKIKVRL